MPRAESRKMKAEKHELQTEIHLRSRNCKSLTLTQLHLQDFACHLRLRSGVFGEFLTVPRWLCLSSVTQSLAVRGFAAFRRLTMYGLSRLSFCRIYVSGVPEWSSTVLGSLLPRCTSLMSPLASSYFALERRWHAASPSERRGDCGDGGASFRVWRPAVRSSSPWVDAIRRLWRRTDRPLIGNRQRARANTIPLGLI